jgi:hypothetical protein
MKLKKKNMIPGKRKNEPIQRASLMNARWNARWKE